MATAVIMPRQGQSVESCILVEWLVNVGDEVAEGAPLASIETDKAVFEVESPAAGTVLAQFFDEGSDVPVLMNIAAIGNEGEDVSDLNPEGKAAPEAPAAEPAEAPAAAPVARPPAAAEAVASSGPSTAISPRARSLATRSGVDATALAGTGPGGRVIERDVAAAAEALPRMSGAAREALAAGGVAAPAAGSGPGGMVLSGDLRAPSAVAAAAPVAEQTDVPMSGIRKIIADRMFTSLTTTAQLTLTRSIDATAILAYRSEVKARGESLGLPNITINDMIVFATARTLLRFPELNAHCLEDRIVQFGQVNMGVAMDTPRGLMVPVLKGASSLSLGEISRRVKPMTEAARQGSINPDLLTGGSFTITNMGMLGVEAFTPILNVPEVAILGVGGLVLRPVADGDGIRHVQTITLSLTIDHRAVDGGPGARFLDALAKTLENFGLALAE
jgi:pyruvate dehydrogenase E2 component (dihydrolipoamide acetyltransferase)